MVLILFFCEPYMDFLPRKKELWGKNCILCFNRGYCYIKYFYSIILWRIFYNKTDFIRKQKGYGINLGSISQGNYYNEGNSNCWRVVLAPSRSIEFLPLLFVLGRISLCSRGETSLLPADSLEHLRKKWNGKFFQNIKECLETPISMLLILKWLFTSKLSVFSIKNSKDSKLIQNIPN